MNIRRHLNFFFLITFLAGGVPRASAEEGMNAVNLEEKIRDRISTAIRPSMSGREFIVSVKLSVKRVPKVEKKARSRK